MIDVIIAAYNAHDTIEQALNSILMQNIVDKLKVYIVNDKSDKDYSSIVKKYKKYLDLTELSYEENRGPGFARNYGLKHSKSPYIVFLDADDIFHSHYSIEMLYNSITKGSYDLVISNFIEELAPDKYLPHIRDKIWDHGKIYRREFIEKNKIFFADERSNEDLFFNYLTILSGAKYSFIDSITYVWQNNKESLTRKNDHEFNHTGLDGYNRNLLNLSKILEKRKNMESKIAKVLFFGLLQMYYTFLHFEKINNEVGIDLLKKSTRDNILFFNKYKDDLDINDKNEIIYNELTKYLKQNNLHLLVLPDKTFDDFLNEVLQYEK